MLASIALSISLMCTPFIHKPKYTLYSSKDTTVTAEGLAFTISHEFEHTPPDKDYYLPEVFSVELIADGQTMELKNAINVITYLGDNRWLAVITQKVPNVKGKHFSLILKGFNRSKVINLQ